MRPPRKRKRSSTEQAELGAEKQTESVSQSGREVDLWDAFREDHVESVEQLPLSLHRNFTLLNEIDAQALVLESTIPPKIREYIRRRQMADLLRDTSCKEKLRPLSSGKFVDNAYNLADAAQILPSMSSHVNDLLHEMEEKVNLAQAMYDTVDRHVRFFDQTIREHELLLKIDPSATRFASRTGSTTALQKQVPNINDYLEASRTTVTPNARPGLEGKSLTHIASRTRRTSRAQLPSMVDGDLPEDTKDLRSSRLTKDPITVVTAFPPSSVISLQASDMPIDPNEPRYCYCGGFSWGEMIACDAAGCEREWFHLQCVGLTEAPKRSKWYCDMCKESNPSGVRRRGW